MKHTHFVGIDPGHSGAVAYINADASDVRAWPMPVRNRKGTTEMDLDELYNLLGRLKHLPSVVVGLEWPNTYQGSFGDVVRHAEVFGRGKGILEAFLHLMAFDYSKVSPSAWKGKLGLPGKTWDKNSAQGHAYWVQHYPKHAGVVVGPRGGLLDGPLDALLIAHYTKLGHGTLTGHKGGRRPAVFRGLDPNPLGDWMRQLDVPHDEIK